MGIAAGMALSRGGTSPGARVCLVLASAALLLLEWLPRARGGRGLEPADRPWLGVWLAVSGLVALQLAPLPAAALGYLGGWPDAALGAPELGARRLSPRPLVTAGVWAAFTAYWCIAWTTARLPSVWVRRVAAALVGLVAFEAAYGLAALAQGSDTVLGLWPREHYLSDATGTFVNRNHFAGLLALGWPLALALATDARAARRLAPAARLAAAFAVSALFGCALVASHSRLGLAAGLLGAGVFLGLRHGRRRGSPRLRRTVWVPAIALGVAGVLLLRGGDLGLLAERSLRLGAEGDERTAVWGALVERLPARVWVLGWGAGAFEDVFKTVQPGPLRNSYAHAHSDALELLLDFGVLGVLALAGAALHFARCCLPAAPSYLQLAALASLSAAALRSLGDFDLHVPGVACAAWVCVGIAAQRRPEA